MSDLVIDVRAAAIPQFSGRRPDGRPEWPPSPARLFSALVAGAHTLDPDSCAHARAALTELEKQPPPVILAGSFDESSEITSYPQKHPFDTPGSKADKSTLARYWKVPLPGFGKGTAELTDAPVRWIHHPVVTFVVHRAGQLAEALDLAASGVGTFGRSSDSVLLDVHEVDGYTVEEFRDGRDVWRPLGGGGDVRVWGPGYLAALDERHDLVSRRDAAVRVPHPDGTTPRIHYVHTAEEEKASLLRVIPLDQALAGAKIADTLGEASRVVAPCGVRAFPAVNYSIPHGDGRLFGIGLCRRSEDSDLVGAAVALLDSTIPLDPGREGDARWSTDPRLYLQSSRHWRTATPMRSYPNAEVAAAAACVELARLSGCSPDQVEVTVERATGDRKGCSPTVGRAPGLTEGGVGWYVTVVIPHEISGPVQVGFDTDLGAGLLVPAAENQGGENE